MNSTQSASPAFGEAQCSAAASLAKAIFEVESTLEEAKWFASDKQWILASVRISRAAVLLKAAQKLDEQHNDQAQVRRATDE